MELARSARVVHLNILPWSNNLSTTQTYVWIEIDIVIVYLQFKVTKVSGVKWRYEKVS
jgi:hypothetical protein